MTNSDNTFGTFNKITHIAAQPYDGSTALTTFSNTTEAKNFFFTADALTVFDETCTELQWAVVNDARGDATSLKWTMTFGTKGVGTAAADDWSEQHKTRKQALIDAPLKSFAIQGASQDNGSSAGEGTWIVTVTANGHTFDVGDKVTVSGIVGMTEMNEPGQVIVAKATNTFDVLPDTHSYTDYVSGGTASSFGVNKWSNNLGTISTSSDHLF